MLRISHRMLAAHPHEIGTPPGKVLRAIAGEQNRLIKEFLSNKDCPVIVADNVAEYYGASDRTEWDANLFNMSPPFGQCFVEWQFPAVWKHRDRETGEVVSIDNAREVTDISQAGAMLVAYEPVLVDEYEKQLRGKMFQWAHSPSGSPEAALVEASQKFSTQLRKVIASFSDGYGWMLRGSLLYVFSKGEHKGKIFNPCSEVWLFVSKEGKFLSAITLDSLSLAISHQQVLSEYHIPLLTFSFMHCKNVVRKPASKEYNPEAKWLRRMKQPELKYTVLEINPLKPRIVTEGDAGIAGTGGGRSLHICRGHFSTYTAERPLFGKLVGTFWIPAHVRGSQELGEVRKTYEIKGAADPET